jgi:outer membrane protein assembly factor BamB
MTLHLVYRLPLVALAAWTLLAMRIAADDWPQWMGPGRDDRWNETGIIEQFPKEGAKIVWRTPIAGGYSGPAVAAGRVYVTDYVCTEGEAKNDPGGRPDLKGRERVLCLDAATGGEVWKYEYDCPYKISYPAGPRATPTVAGGKVYTLGAEGNLICFDAAKGQVLWQKDLQKEYKALSPMWGFCGHPLVDGPKLICLVGGPGSAAVAFDIDTGKELWKAISGTPDAGYCPPSIIEAGGKRQLLIWTPQTLNSLNPDNGQVYWTEPLVPQYGMSIAAPQKSGDLLYVSGIGSVGVAYKLAQDKPGIEIVWEGKPNSAVYCASSTPLIEGGVIYGNDCQVGNLRAVDLATGKRLWESFEPTTGGERRASHGTVFLTKNGDRYFLFSETGDLIIARLTKEGYQETSRAHILEPTHEAFGRSVVWSHPAYANRCAYVRNDKEIVCVSLAK